MYVVDFGDYRVGVTGDFNVEDTNVTRGAEGMEDVDMLIMESTYGSPEFLFPRRGEIYDEILGLVEDNGDRPLVFLGHPLGKGQELTMLLRKWPLYIQRNIKIYNELNRELWGVGKYLVPGTVHEGSVVIMSFPRDKAGIANYVRNRLRINNPLLVLVSGFYANPTWTKLATKHGLHTYPLSSHSDFRGLVEFALRSRAKIIYTVYGNNVYFAKYLRRKYNIMARPIAPENQSSIYDYTG
jgi:putative mRNA 3-end processing factor